MIQSTRISMGLFFKYFLSLTKIDPGQNYISLPSIKSSTHIALLFMVSMGTQKLKAQSFFIFSLLLTLILFCITTLYNENTGNDSNLLIVFYVQIMPDDFVMQLHRF